MTKRTTRTGLRAAVTGTLATALLGLAPHAALAAETPAPPPAPSRASVAAAHDVAAAPATLDTLTRFFAAEAARNGARAGAAAPGAAKTAPRIEGGPVPVYVLSPDFVRGKAKALVARLEFLASKAVAADGRKASVWSARQGTSWKVVNIASGDDESRYTAAGRAKPGAGTVFHEPQIDAWYVQRGDRVEPLDEDAVKAVGARGTSLAAYQKRVAKAYGDKLPGSAYDKRGEAGGYGPQTGSRAGSATAADVAADDAAKAGARKQPVAADTLAGDSFPVTAASTVAGVAALVALGLLGTAAVRRRRTG
ncbi:hypothetical protein FCH28_21605 [Streptomyces piniterrae]|uniref:LPXTG cell wall anchor domain-containing protein n=1 Tax=Streptomyces piniterrae TaxID=2571125 RepID=A0A4U0NC50_9ACTN|nr:hypothetical protein [Streptomyces piniterrae]TJZ51092.1 hypothetical protein FCH28_21605 [Streptomyces piniterrae]